MRDLLKAIFKTGSGSVASLGLGMIAVKIMAVILGPSGVGLFSLLRQTQQTALTVAVLNGQMAVVQGVASREGRARDEYLSTVLWIQVVIGATVSFVLLVFAPQITRWVISQTDPKTVEMIRWLSLTIILGVIHTYLTSLLNGYRAIGRVALVQVSNFGMMALLAFPAAWLMKAGYPIAFTWLLTASTFTAAGLSFWFALRSGWLAWLREGMRRNFSRPAAQHFFYLAGTMLITGFIGAGVPLAVRALVAHQFGLHGAGIFDVAWTLSMAYVTLILTSFSTYYLPTLSQTVDPGARVDLIRRVLRLAMLLMVPLVVTVITLKPLVVKLLYSGEFLPALQIMRWMLIGDYFKVVSWVFSFTMIAYADMKTFFWTEVLWGGLTLGCALLVLQGLNSLQGIGVNFLALYVAYLAYTLFYVRRRHHLILDRPVVLQWLVGLVLVIGASVQTWNETQVQWATAGLWISVALGSSWFALSNAERAKISRVLSSRLRVKAYN